MMIMHAKDGNKTDNKRLGVMLAIVIALAILVLLKDDAEDTDMIELVNNKQVQQSASASNSASKTIKKSIPLNSSEPVQSVNIPWQKLQRQPLVNQVDNVFKVHSWLVVPKVAKIKEPPPPPPMAPPAPFTYMGKLEDSPKGTQVFLMRDGKLYTVIKGQKIDAQWRLDSEENNSIRLTYLPLNLPQILAKSAKPNDIAPPVSAEMNL